ncbi:hypothetical protein [Sphingobacterium thalpophilum]|uniref:hypothetical protein n=1 Tax=Sphingobacterium thalpophilum TaxID=259 RepID=UPI002D773CD2|nr:hypothetical protein [Sphingobacterium thalpophilum]
MKRSKSKVPLFYCLLFLSFTSCEKEVLNDSKVSGENSDISQNYGGFTVIGKKDRTLVIFNKKTRSKMNYSEYLSGSNPEYVFTPEKHIFDGAALQHCEDSPPENEIFFQFTTQDDNNISYNLYNNGTFAGSVFDKKPTFFYNIKDNESTEKFKEYLDCWCDHDPTETVKEL